MMRHACVLVAALGLAGCLSEEPGGTAGPVTLTIQNAAEAPLRCVAVLAHFVTRDIAPIAPGERLALTLDRDPATGTLAYGSHREAPMMVENLLCGTGESWTATRGDISLTAVRAGDAAAYVALCTLQDGVTCTVAQAPQD